MNDNHLKTSQEAFVMIIPEEGLTGKAIPNWSVVIDRVAGR